MSILSKTEKVHFRFLPGGSVNVQEEIQTSKDSICNSYGIYALKLLHAVVHSVKGNRLKGMTSLMKPIQLDRSSLAVSAWYWSMFCLYWEGKYSDVINGVNSVVNGNILSVRDLSIATNLLACSLMKQNRITAAIALLRQCLQENFSYLLPLYNLSVMYGKQERVTAKLESLHLLTMALHQENESVMKKEPAILLDAAHGKSKPKIIVQNIIEWQPSSLLVFYMLARSCLDAGRFSDAADHYIDLLSALTDLSCVPSTAHKACESGQQELPSLVTIYYESALSQTKSGRLLDALLIIKKIQEKLPHPPTYCANPGKVEHPSTSSVQEDAVEDQSDDGTFPGRKRQREMSESHFQLEASDDRVNENFYSYVKIRLLEVFCLVRCHRVEEALNCIDSVLKLLNKCQGVHKKEMQHSSKKIKLDQGDMPASIANVENQSEHPVLRLKAEAYNNKAVILIGQNKLQDANELLLNSIHCCPGFVDTVYNHTLLLFKLGNQSTASTDWLRFRYADVALNSSMVSHLLAKTASSLKDIKLVPSSSSVEGIPQYSLLMMDKIALEIRMNVNKM
ncbi:Fanconi anemia group G protein-like isoform X2 [Anneissia japonica]|uniref:Fanconi anemia group G protein-like isoform X2 n=1 Tax=Anneissia japonica TaxID=1529436 RepID=UPI00142570B2|nr:Fanconi anemia group G protein-like isoform X2 [Anneissia japonica]